MKEKKFNKKKAVVVGGIGLGILAGVFVVYKALTGGQVDTDQIADSMSDALSDAANEE